MSWGSDTTILRTESQKDIQLALENVFVDLKKKTFQLGVMLLEKNNMHEFDVANIYKWVFKTACAILILSNTFNIVMAVFDVSQSVICLLYTSQW